MSSIRNIKNSFNTPEMFAVFSECMFMPTWENFTSKAKDFINQTTISIFGWFIGDLIVGIIVVDKLSDEKTEIKGIAVDVGHRKHGIGKQLVQYVCLNLSLSILYAETDDDAILFYKRCGFETEEFIKIINDGEYKRYKCTLCTSKS